MTEKTAKLIVEGKKRNLFNLLSLSLLLLTKVCKVMNL